MDAGKVLISDIFNGANLLEIPFYQRAYVWKDEQWSRFLEDMEYVTECKKQYFLGSVILKNGESPHPWDGYSAKKIVIDGQQRLTTFMIFMKVLCLKTNEMKSFNKRFRLDDDSIALKHGRNDITAFEKVMEQETADTIENPSPESKIISAYNYFINNLNPEKVEKNTVSALAQFVCIDLDNDEDEQQVFNTINSLGVRLTTAELLKNYFFHRDNVEEFDKNWVEVFEKDDESKMYWDQEFETGRIKRSLIDIFFDAYFQLFVLDPRFEVKPEDKIAYSRVDHLAKSYQDFIANYCNGDKSVILENMSLYAKVFRETFNPDYCNIMMPAKSCVNRINVIVFGLKYSVLIPYILYVATKVDDEEEKNKIYGILESYIMRRLVLHLSTKNYNRIVNSFILTETCSAASLAEKLRNAEDPTNYFPDNAELLKGFNESKLYNLHSKGVIYFIESAIRPSSSGIVLHGFNGYSLEHLMPKKWENNWPACDTEEEKNNRNSKLLTLGNLAIIPQALNASIRDSDWNTKKKGKGSDKPGLVACANGLLTLTDALSKEVWDESEIEKRAQWLYEQAAFLWKL